MGQGSRLWQKVHGKLSDRTLFPKGPGHCSYSSNLYSKFSMNECGLGCTMHFPELLTEPWINSKGKVVVNTVNGSSHGRFFIPGSSILEEVKKTLVLLLLTSQMLGDYSNRSRRSKTNRYFESSWGRNDLPAPGSHSQTSYHQWREPSWPNGCSHCHTVLVQKQYSGSNKKNLCRKNTSSTVQ